MQLFKMTNPLVGVFVTIVGMFVGGQAHAATLMGTSTDPLGINGLVVGGVTYNVNFNASEDASPAFLGNASGAAAAALALAATLNDFGVSSIGGDPPVPYQNFYLLIPETLWVAPTSPSGPYDQDYGTLAQCLLCNYNGQMDSNASWTSGTYVLNSNLNSGPPHIHYANFTALSSPVPVPTAAWLFGSGLLGLIGVARRKAA